MKKFTVEFTWAVIYTLSWLLWTVFEKALGFHDEKIGSQMLFSMLFWLVAIPVYFFALRDKLKTYYNGKANWTQLFLSGALMAVFAALLFPLAVYIATNVVSPDFIRNGINYLVENRKISVEKAEYYFGYRSMVLQGVGSGISVGVMISSIVALILKTQSGQPTPAPQPKPKKKKK